MQINTLTARFLLFSPPALLATFSSRAHLSHAYPDGCSIYFTFAGSAATDDEAIAKYDDAWRAALGAAIGAGGTLSHHHGVGRSKAPRLGAELGLGIDVIRALRNELDPSGILNPGNLLPREGGPRELAPIAPPPAQPVIDRTSCLVRVSGAATLGEVERALVAEVFVQVPRALDLWPQANRPLFVLQLLKHDVAKHHGHLNYSLDWRELQ